MASTEMGKENSNYSERSAKIEESIYTKNLKKQTAEKIAAEKELEKYKAENQKKIDKQQLDALEKRLKYQREEQEKAEKELNEIRIKNEEERQKYIKEQEDNRLKNEARDRERMTSNLSASINQGVTTLKSNLDNTMNSFLAKQQSIAYNINGYSAGGTAVTFKSLTDNLNRTLGSNSIVKQQAVYDNLSKLIDQGIIYNVEQRSYLQTLSDDLGMVFSQESKSLNRLINLWREDISSNKMAIEASLKTFLNQNYMTSQYIKEGFQSVSDSLIEAQSLFTKENRAEGIKFEASVQQWLGSLSSVGMDSSTISSLATAIGQLGSGDINSLSGSNLQTLLLLGANRTGLSYGDMLINGVDSTTADALLSGVTSYMSQVYANNADNNVVLSSFANILGVKVSDLIAAYNVKTPTLTTGNTSNYLNTDIASALLNKIDGYMYLTNKFSNLIENMTYTWGTSIASDQVGYTAYRLVDTLADVVGDILDGTTLAIQPLGLGVDLNVAQLIKAAPLGMTGNGLLAALGGLFGNGFSSATDLYRKLGGTGTGAADYGTINVGGNLLGISTKSGVQQSGSVVMTNNNTSDIAKGAKNSGQDLGSETLGEQGDSKSMDDIYNMLDSIKYCMKEELPAKTYSVKLDQPVATNSVTVATEETTDVNTITTISDNIYSIFELLQVWFQQSNPTYDISTIYTQPQSGLVANTSTLGAGM